MVLQSCRAAQPLVWEGIVQAASLTKPAIAFALLELACTGLIDLQAPISDYLPQGYEHRQNPFAAVAERKTDKMPVQTLSRISVDQLLNHSSGLPNWSDGILALAFEPGTRWQYSGEGYVLL
ncbi:serine hydrolase [Lampropedia puyangensis]|uniref:serine hydrolase n=1 Tax=Lampropedia puyangensis TaxID=1330072 RepID=UPI001305487C|nr:serine hydrolase [Lampropedia puyangensis]